jgi:hypothetical protein
MHWGGVQRYQKLVLHPPTIAALCASSRFQSYLYFFYTAYFNEISSNTACKYKCHFSPKQENGHRRMEGGREGGRL